MQPARVNIRKISHYVTPDKLTAMRFFTIAMVLASLAASAPQKPPRKPKKAADVQVVETKARREEGKINVDGKVKVTGEKPLHGLVIVFDFRSPEKEVVTTQKTTVDEATLETGREGAYHVELADAARAVTYTVRAFDGHEKELRVENVGPFSIE
jgi:hypothetical protein